MNHVCFAQISHQHDSILPFLAPRSIPGGRPRNLFFVALRSPLDYRKYSRGSPSPILPLLDNQNYSRSPLVGILIRYSSLSSVVTRTIGYAITPPPP
jgi:hypothetical protein